MWKTIRISVYTVSRFLSTLFRARSLHKKMNTIPREELQRFTHNFTETTARGMLRSVGASVTVKGLENIPENEPVLFVSNHQGNFDIILIAGYIGKPVGFLSKIEVKKIPVLGMYMELMHCVFIDRNNRRQAIESLKEAVSNLKNGYSLVVCPEGTRSNGGPMVNFKQGSLRYALDAKVPIVPLAVSDAHKIMEAGPKLFNSAHLTLEVLPAISNEVAVSMDSKELVEYVQTQIESKLKPEYRRAL